MWQTMREVAIKQIGRFTAVGLLVILVLCASVPKAHAALNPIGVDNPQSGSFGMEATKTQPAPTETATITTPSTGMSFSDSPITVAGLCKTGLIVQIYDNGTLVGAIDCTNGSYSLQVSLFTGVNDLTAVLFDDLGQGGPVSNQVSVNYNNANFSAFGTLITLTSNYARRAANPGSTLTWPLILSGGTGPYAFSIDWGDGNKADLKSVTSPGNLDVTHVYKQAGLYHVTVKVTDVNGVTAFLQLVAVANGKPATSAGAGTTKTVTVVKWIWIPAVVTLVLLFPAYWLGRRSELVSLHRQLEKNMENFKEI